MNEDIFLIREEPVRRLGRVILAILDAVRRGDTAEGRNVAALNIALEAECAGCRTRIKGAELLVLARSASGRIDPRIARLRRGRCANESCPHENYRVILKVHPDLNWSRLLSQTTPASPPDDQPGTGENSLDPAAESAPRYRGLLRIGALAAAVLLALLVRQWYYGGQIPLIRQPENFRVAPLPPGTETNLPGKWSPATPRRVHTPSASAILPSVSASSGKFKLCWR
jgi:hypothetical protein